MYTILVNDDNELITTTSERILQRSKLVNKLHFLVPPMYKDEYDMTNFTMYIEYLSPLSKEYHTEVLVRSEEMYKEHLEYILPFDTRLTKESGNVELQASFICIEKDEEGNKVQRVRKTTSTMITVVPLANWSEMISDTALTALDQRLLAAECLLADLSEVSEMLYENQVNDLTLTEDQLQLSAHGKTVGNGVKVLVPAVDDGKIDGNPNGFLDLDYINI